jgi:Zn-dependent peptidase ImmA (M78 family)
MRKTNAFIEQVAENFLKKHHPLQTIPIPIETLIELQLCIHIIPIKNLLSVHQLDGFVSHDCTELYIDEDSYMRQTNRARFTLAHELGHIVLHQALLKNIQTIEQWKKFVLGEGTGRAIYETEANRFAGCLLLPQAPLLRAFEVSHAKVARLFKQQQRPIPEPENIIEYAAVEIAKHFGVSEQCTIIRLSNLLDCPVQTLTNHSARSNNNRTILRSA